MVMAKGISNKPHDDTGDYFGPEKPGPSDVILMGLVCFVVMLARAHYTGIVSEGLTLNQVNIRKDSVHPPF